MQSLNQIASSNKNDKNCLLVLVLNYLVRGGGGGGGGGGAGGGVAAIKMVLFLHTTTCHFVSAV